MSERRIGRELTALFAALQLKADSLIDEKLKLDKWNGIIRKLVHGDLRSETPRLKLKRNAYATARMEIVTVREFITKGMSKFREEREIRKGV